MLIFHISTIRFFVSIQMLSYFLKFCIIRSVCCFRFRMFSTGSMPTTRFSLVLFLADQKHTNLELSSVDRISLFESLNQIS